MEFLKQGPLIKGVLVDKIPVNERKSGLMQRDGFYQEHLDRVSRSFAFCIKKLQSPLRQWVGLSYILCRIVDTVEDSQWAKRSQQRESFSKFLHFITEEQSLGEVENWVKDFPESIPQSERRLLEDASRFFKDLHELSDPIKSQIQKTVLNMTHGMIHFSENKTSGRQLKLESLAETNQYCFFVAGVVGELLTDIVAVEMPDWPCDQKTYLRACHFGLFLQKVNVLKDHLSDLREGRDFISSRQELRESLNENCREAFAYIKVIPPQNNGYRLFCAWSFFLGLASLPYIDESWEKQKVVKISRLKAWQVLGKVEEKIGDNQALEELFQKMSPSMVERDESAKTEKKESGEEHWFQSLYKGRLSLSDMLELGML